MELDLEYEAFFATPEGREFLENEYKWHATGETEWWSIREAMLLDKTIERFGDRIIWYVRDKIKRMNNVRTS